MDRSSDEALKDSQDESSWDSFKRKRMTSILQTIELGNDDRKKSEIKTWWHLPVESMNLSEQFFPKEDFGSTPPDYTSLWDKFIGEFNFIQANTYRAFSESLLNILF